MTDRRVVSLRSTLSTREKIEAAAGLKQQIEAMQREHRRLIDDIDREIEQQRLDREAVAV